MKKVKLALWLFLLLAAALAGAAQNTSQMSNEETVVRSTYAKLSFATKQVAMAQLALEATGFAGQTTSQITHVIQGATVTVSNLDFEHGTATLEIFNQSNKDITAYSVAMEAVWRDGQVDRSEKLLDYGAVLSAKGDVLHPGQTGTQSLGYPTNPLGHPTSPDNPLISVKATLSAVVFGDETSDASNSEALGEIVNVRESMASLTQVSVKAVSQALATTSPHPGAVAAGIVRQQIPNLPETPGARFKGYMEPLAQELEKAPQKAARAGVTERQFLEQHLTELQEQLQKQQDYAVIRRQK